MPAHRTVSSAQEQKLIELMADYPALATGRISSHSSPLAKQNLREQWEKVATILNSFGTGATKSGAKWKEYWHEKKYRARKRAADLKSYATGTGGGPSKGHLTDTEEKIINIITPAAVYGEPSVQLPFNEPPESQQSSPLIVIVPDETEMESLPATPWLGPTSTLEEAQEEQSSSITPQSSATSGLDLGEVQVVQSSSTTQPNPTSAPRLGEAEQERPPSISARPRRQHQDNRQTYSIPGWALSLENRRYELEQRRLEVDNRRLELDNEMIELLRRGVSLLEQLLEAQGPRNG